MSKMDGLRAMREARYEQAKTQAREAGIKPAYARRPAPAAAPRQPVEDAAPEVAQDQGLCGHRNISGRTCTREQGHAAKSHRYS